MSSIKDYTDLDGLVSNLNVLPKQYRTCDNGVAFTAEYLVLDALLNKGIDEPYFTSILSCVDNQGRVHRDPTDSSEDAPDDIISLLSMLLFFGFTSPKVTFPFTQAQPMLVYLSLIQKNSPLQYLFSIPMAVLMAISNLNSPPGDTSNRLLSWMIAQALKKRTWLGALGAKIWEYRQRREYDRISLIFEIYFGASHPLADMARQLEQK